MRAELRLNVLDDAAQVSPGHIRGDHDPALHVLAEDHVRPLFTADVGEQSDRHACSGGRVDGYVTEPLEVGAGRGIELHDEIEGSRPVEDSSHGRPCQRGLHRVRHFIRAQTVAGDRGAIEHEADERHVHLLLERNVHGAWNGGHDVPHPFAEPAQRRQIVAEDLDGDVGARAREHVIDPVRDRLPDRHIGPGQRGEPAPQRRQQTRRADDRYRASRHRFQQLPRLERARRTRLARSGAPSPRRRARRGGSPRPAARFRPT